MTSCSEHGMKDSGDESRLKSTEGRRGMEAGGRRWQCWARRENKKRRVGRTRTFCASHKRQEVNAQKGSASEPEIKMCL